MNRLLTSLSALMLGKLGAASPAQMAQHVDGSHRHSPGVNFRRPGSAKPAFRKAKVRANVKASRKASVRTRRGW